MLRRFCVAWQQQRKMDSGNMVVWTGYPVMVMVVIVAITVGIAATPRLGEENRI